MLLPLANTITPVMGADCTYLIFMNVVIGILEASLLRRWFCGTKRAVWWMIAANYLSAWAGWFALLFLVNPWMEAFLGSRPIERINLLAAMVVLVAFAITIIVEIGFVHLATDRDKRSRGRTIRATLCVNAFSYLLICSWFMWLSFSLPLNAHVTDSSDLGTLSKGNLYWVDPTGQVMAKALNGEAAGQPVGQVTLNNSVQPYQLRIERSDNPERVQMVVMYSSIENGATSTPVNHELPYPAFLADAGSAAAFPADYWDHFPVSRKSVFDTRATESRFTQFRFDWYRKFLKTDVPNGPHSRLTIGFATIDWDMKEPTVLPDEKIVFEWAGQIIIFDPHTQKLAFVALGTCPAFIPESK
jgi:hypothetical protein